MNPLSWSLLTPDAIDRPGIGRFSGRVTDIRTHGDVVIVATALGGAWTIQKDVSILTGFQTRSLSDDWDDPDVQCLENGPDGDHQLYAGCSRTLTYFEITGDGSTTTVVNLPVLAAYAGATINRIVVDAEPSRRRIILATDAGVCWSPIPTNPASASGYAWSQATGLTGTRVGGLCAAKKGAVHAALWGPETPGATDFGIFKGTFSSGALVFARSIQPTDQMMRVSLASCAANRDKAFAVWSHPDKSFGGALRYDAGSDTWSDPNFTFSQPPGNQGGFNNCIAVAPDDANVVAFGWQTGPFVLQNHLHWQDLQPVSSEVRGDLHGLWFTPKANGKHTLYAGGDGGILQVDGPAQASPSFDDRLNSFLPTLLFKNQPPAKESFATTDVSHTDDGLVAGGTQDNGVEFLATAADSFSTWSRLLGGDGGTNVFLTNGTLIARESNASSKFGAFRFDSTTRTFGAGTALPIDVDIATEPRIRVCARVVTPTFQNGNGELLHAISSAVPVGSSHSDVLGLFGDAMLNGPHWAVIGKGFQLVTAVGSMDGRHVLVADDQGGVFSLDAATGDKPALALPASLEPGFVTQFEVVSASLVFALYQGKAAGHLLVFDGQAWREIPLPVSQRVFSIAVDWSTYSVYIATDSAVYQGTQVPYGQKQPIGFDTMFEWVSNSAGLPVRPHCAHLRIGPDRGVSYLYLATNGRSVYRAPLTVKTTMPGTGKQAGVTIVFGVIQDGGGGARITGSGHVIIVPPRQEMQAVLADLLASERLRDNTSREASAERRAALERVQAFVQAQLAKPRE